MPSLPTAFFLSPTSFKRCDSFARALVLDADDGSFWGKKSREKESEEKNCEDGEFVNSHREREKGRKRERETDEREGEREKASKD